MLFQHRERLDELVVKSLAHRHGMSAREIAADIQTRWDRSCSEQALHKELTKLQEQGVVVRLRHRYSLSLSWAMRFVTLADVVYDRYLDSSPLDLILAERTTKRTFRCSDLQKLSNFWMQARLALLQHTGAEVILEWLPHPWEQLLHPTRYRDFLSSVTELNSHLACIIGDRGKLAKEVLGSYRSDALHWASNPGRLRGTSRSISA